jgi:hypothetical protein
MSRTLVLVGLALVAVGLLWPYLGKLGFGRLPGDILIERPGFQLYIPVTACGLIGLLVSGVVWLLNR